jgi:predicted TIM-barrel fold metal-dependent hydrolase
MNVKADITQAPRVGAAVRTKVVDCDIHPVINKRQEIYPFLDEQWHSVLEAYGAPRRRGVQFGSSYTKSQPQAWRRDAWPKNGGNAGGSLELMQTQHLDEHNIELGILIPGNGGSDMRHPGLSAAYCHASNDWQVATFTSKEPRLKASIVVPYNDAASSAREIELRAGDPNFVQVLLYTRTCDPTGHPRYWPIYEAAEAAGLPIGIHAFGDSGHAVTGSGWPSFYFEEMFGHSPSSQSVVMNLIMEGVFERFPKLKVVIVEAGVAWMAPLMWRLDAQWKKLRSEMPHLKRLPSEYIREHIWLTTQPIEEPTDRNQIIEAIDWIGWDRICFSSDYPHWDFDDPLYAMPLNKLSAEQREMYLRGNAHGIYGTGPDTH